MMSETPNPQVELLVQLYVGDVYLWMNLDHEYKGGLNEYDISELLWYLLSEISPTPYEVININDNVSRFDANQDGLLDSTEMIKYSKWLARKIYNEAEPADFLTRNLDGMNAIADELTRMYDQNGDGMMDVDETLKVVDELAVRYGKEEDRNTDISVYYEDYDFNSDGLLNRTHGALH